MVRVLVADRDMDTIRHFRSYIDTNFAADFKIVRVMNDTEQNLREQIRRAEAQLVLLSLRALGVATMRELRTLYEEMPEVKFILYGTYNEEDYMKKSLTLGVLDYMFRPVKPSELHRCLEHALAYFDEQEQLRREERRLVAEYETIRNEFESIFLRSLVKGQIQNDNETEYGFRYFDMPFDKGFSVAIMRVDHYKKVILAMDEKEKHILSYKLLTVAHEQLEGRPHQAFIESFNAVVMVVGGFHELDELLTVYEKIKAEVYRKAKVRVTIGAGRVYEKAADIPVSYKEADAALRYRFYMGYNAVIPIHFVEPMNNITYHYPLEKEERLVYMAVIGEYAYCEVLLREIFDALRDSGPLPDKLVSKIIMNLLISINRYASEQHLPIQSAFTTIFSTGEALQLNGLDEAYEYMCAALQKFCDFIIQQHNQNNEGLYNRAKNYIQQRYYENFSLPKIAMNLDTTPEYLNKLFLDREGKAVFDYVVGVRIQIAKQLMRDNAYDDELIAVKVGYDDGRHFRSVFRQYEGMDTNDYRQNYKHMENK